MSMRVHRKKQGQGKGYFPLPLKMASTSIALILFPSDFPHETYAIKKDVRLRMMPKRSFSQFTKKGMVKRNR